MIRDGPCAVGTVQEARHHGPEMMAAVVAPSEMDCMPTRTRVGNQPYMFAGILARNLTRELRIQIGARARGTTPKRATLWYFREMETLRRNLIRCTGRVIRPAGKLALSMNSNDGREREFRHALTVLNAAA